MGKQVTLFDVAEACGTSNVTVSKALADKKGVSEELRKKIKETAALMGYVSPSSKSGKRDNNGGARAVGAVHHYVRYLKDLYRARNAEQDIYEEHLFDEGKGYVAYLLPLGAAVEGGGFVKLLGYRF